MSEREQPAGDDPAGEFWIFHAEDLGYRVNGRTREDVWTNRVQLCDLCLRVRLFFIKPDLMCRSMIETPKKRCLAKLNQKSAKRLD